MLEITQSGDMIVVTTDTAFLSADFVTKTGSIIPEFIILTLPPVTTSTPSPIFNLLGHSKLALCNIVSNGLCIAFNSNTSPLFSGSIVVDAFNSATPPPGTIPSCNAALVAYIASSILSFFSFFTFGFRQKCHLAKQLYLR